MMILIPMKWSIVRLKHCINLQLVIQKVPYQTTQTLQIAQILQHLQHQKIQTTITPETIIQEIITTILDTIITQEITTILDTIITQEIITILDTMITQEIITTITTAEITMISPILPLHILHTARPTGQAPAAEKAQADLTVQADLNQAPAVAPMILPARGTVLQADPMIHQVRRKVLPADMKILPASPMKKRQ